MGRARGKSKKIKPSQNDENYKKEKSKHQIQLNSCRFHLGVYNAKKE